MKKPAVSSFIALLASLFTLLPFVASAEMVVDNSIIVFKSDGPARQDITVTNSGNEPLYLKVTPHIITHPGTADEKRVKITDPRASGLLVSPHKLVIAAGAKKRIRFVNLHPQREEETVFRVTIEPVTGELTPKRTGIKVMVGYEVLVLAEPADAQSDLQASRDGNRLILTNQGNVNALLFRGQQCPANSDSPKNCISLHDKRLYPGNSWEIELPGDGPVEFHVADSNGNSLKTFR